MDRNPYDDTEHEFSYGTFRKEAVSDIPHILLHLEASTERLGRNFGDLGDRLASLITGINDEATLCSPEEQYLLGEALVQFTSAVLFVGNIALSVTSVQAHLLQVGVRVSFVEEGNGSIELVLGSLERLYAAGLSLFVPQELLETVCGDALL